MRRSSVGCMGSYKTGNTKFGHSSTHYCSIVIRRIPLAD
jgi:hypothetical protein